LVELVEVQSERLEERDGCVARVAVESAAKVFPDFGRRVAYRDGQREIIVYRRQEHDDCFVVVGFSLVDGPVSIVRASGDGVDVSGFLARHDGLQSRIGERDGPGGPPFSIVVALRGGLGEGAWVELEGEA
jgi:hypothetical protein